MSTWQRLFPITRHANPANALTTANALCGLLGAYAASQGATWWALLCGGLALPCDVFDGVLARRYGTASAFGAQLDSLADALSFCLLPATLSVSLGLPWYAKLAALLYVLAGILRLARFAEVGTTQAQGQAYFEGVPTPFAGALVIPLGAALLSASAASQALWMTAFYLLAAPAMVSALPFPKAGWHTKALWVLVPLALVLTLGHARGLAV